MATRKLNLLVLDDDPEMTLLLADVLGSRFVVRTANSETEAMAAMRRQLPDVLLSDYHLGHATSASFLEVVARRLPMIRRILMSGSPAAEWGALLRDGIVEAAVAKPFSINGLIAALEGEEPLTMAA